MLIQILYKLLKAFLVIIPLRFVILTNGNPYKHGKSTIAKAVLIH